jgi:integrase
MVRQVGGRQSDSSKIRRAQRRKSDESPGPSPGSMPAGAHSGDGELSFDVWADLWLAMCRGRLRPSTCHAYEKALRRVRPLIGDAQLSDLTPAFLFTVVARLGDHGRRSAQESYAVLRTCLQAAADIHHLPDNPMVKVPKPRWEPKQRDYWSVAETRRFIAHALESPRRWAPLCAFLVTTGLRVSEALGLTWGDVDLEGRRVRVREPLVHVNGTPIPMPPKTKAGRRWVTLDSTALAALGRIPVGANNDGVFRTRTGRPPTHGTIRTTLLVLCEESGVPPLNPHGLRHVAAMLAIKATRDIYLVQRRLGHAHPSITVGIYGYSLGGDDEVAHALDRIISQAESST